MQLSSLFHPRSIAIIGASTQPGSVGSSIARNIIERFPGKSYPVNPKTTELFGQVCFPSILAIPEVVDLAIIVVPAALVPIVLAECGEKQVPAVIIISAGFKETGESGKALEAEVTRIAETHQITVLGPNCLGFLAPAQQLNASFAATTPKAGPIAFFSQSGALLTALLDMSGQSLGYRVCVSTGNKALLRENDLLKFFAADEATKVIAFYSEDIVNAKSFIETGRALLKRVDPKPVVVLKSGRTAAGTAASSSHTGALAGSDAAYQALFAQAGMVRVDDLESLLGALEVFSKNPLPSGKRMAILTNAGGLGVMTADACVARGLELATLLPETVESLRSFLPAAASSHNPIDVLGDARADRYERALSVVLADPNVDMLLVIITPQAMTEALSTAQAVSDAREHFPMKPVVVSLSGGPALKEAAEFLQTAAVATLRSPEAATLALGQLAGIAEEHRHFSETLFDTTDIENTSARAIIDQALGNQRMQLSETQCLDILTLYGFRPLMQHLVHSPQEALEAAQRIGKPVALKIVSPDITHKSDAGGILLHIDPDQAATAYDTLLANVATRVPEAKLEGALVVEMAATGGIELILGLKKEPGLGTLVMLGLGGIFVEVFQDASFRFAEALTREDAQAMVRELKSFPILQGTRGKDGIDQEALVEAIGRLARLAVDFPEIAELDINPLLAFQNGSDFRVIDARIRLER